MYLCCDSRFPISNEERLSSSENWWEFISVDKCSGIESLHDVLDFSIASK